MQVCSGTAPKNKIKIQSALLSTKFRRLPLLVAQHSTAQHSTAQNSAAQHNDYMSYTALLFHILSFWQQLHQLHYCCKQDQEP